MGLSTCCGVTLSRKGAKSRTGGRKLRSTGTKTKTRVAPSNESQAALITKLKAHARDLEKKLEARAHELAEALEQQTATSAVLRVISTSPTDTQPVFDAILESATELCAAETGILFRYAEGAYHALATRLRDPHLAETFKQSKSRRPAPDSQTGLGRLMRERRAVHIPDMLNDPAYDARDPLRLQVLQGGMRSWLGVPMLKEGELIGAIVIYRSEQRAFTEQQIALLQTFADQAVIAIANARLFDDVQKRTRELAEALEQQTATSEVLQVISRSPGALEPVFEAMLGNATRLCGANFGVLWLVEGDGFRSVAMYGLPPAHAEERQREPVIYPTAEDPLSRLRRTKRIVHIADLRDDESYIRGFPPLRAVVDAGGGRTLLVVPMLKDNALVGAVAIYSQEVRPFTDKQIALVANFAAQAVIAIENTRLLNELRESLQQQTATSEVLKAISSSPGELTPVFETMLESATRICEAKFGTLALHEGNDFRNVAMHGVPIAFRDERQRQPMIHPGPGHHLARLLETRKLVHITDI